jgi:hypothetical protein
VASTWQEVRWKVVAMSVYSCCIPYRLRMSHYSRSRWKHAPLVSSCVVFALAAAGGRHHSIAFTSDGEAFAWGYNMQGQLGSGSVRKGATKANEGDACWCGVLSSHRSSSVTSRQPVQVRDLRCVCIH